jgi:adenosylcobinamide-GDP ribazoletransferase
MRAALALLTRLPVLAPDGRTGSAAFAAAGALVAAVAAVPAALLAGPAPLLGTMLTLAAIEGLTGALHLDGLADTADALAAPDPVRAEAARKDPRIGSAGAGAIVLVLGAAAGALVAIPGWALVGAVAVAGAASRAVPAVVAPTLGRRGGDHPQPGFGSWFAASSGRGGALSSLATCAVVAAAAAAAATWLAPGAGQAGAGQAGVADVARVAILASAAGACAGLATGIAVAAGLLRSFGRLVGDHYGAAVEVAFVGALAAQAIAWGAMR